MIDNEDELIRTSRLPSAIGETDSISFAGPVFGITSALPRSGFMIVTEASPQLREKSLRKMLHLRQEIFI
jgi:hypothetical protein